MNRGFRAVMQFVDGGDQDFDYEDGQEIIESWFGDDWGPPPRHWCPGQYATMAGS